MKRLTKPAFLLRLQDFYVTIDGYLRRGGYTPLLPDKQETVQHPVCVQNDPFYGELMLEHLEAFAPDTLQPPDVIIKTIIEVHDIENPWDVVSQPAEDLEFEGDLPEVDRDTLDADIADFHASTSILFEFMD